MPESDPSAAIQTPSAAPVPGGLPGESPPFPVPDHTLIRRVGRGAYGEVWLARNALGTWRAVKFVRRSSFDDDKPFERELAGIQRFEPISRSHESQLNILHVGRAEDGFYYIMELADDMSGAQASGGTSYTSPNLSTDAESGPLGTRPSDGEDSGTRGTRPSGSLDDLLNPDTYTPRNLRSELHLRGRLPAAECLRIGLALTTALEHLHKHGLVHRDIKPSNIVFVNGIPKLADIGLVARAEATISFVGTEGFLPPEGPGTRPADIFSLGKVLYEISTGHDRQQFPELPTNIIELPDRAELSELNEVLLKACHRDPQERYQTAAEMHAELALLESGRSVLRLRGIEKRLRIVQRAGAVVTAVGALIAGGWWWQAQQTARVRELAQENLNLVKLVNTSAALARRNGAWAREAPDATDTNFAHQALQAEQLRLEQALQACTRALALIGSREKALGLDLTLHRQRGSLLRALGRMDEAAVENLKLFGIPARDPALPAAAIDLSAYYTTTLAWDASKGKLGSDLSELPVGPQVLAGTLFDVRALINLTQNPEWGYWPTRVDGIRIGRKLARLHFLHSAGGWDAGIQAGDRIGRYRLHYADGRTADLPLRYHVDTADWWEHPERPKELPEATVVWRGFTMRGRPEGPQPIRLFNFTWENPHPDIEVTELDVVAEYTLIVPMLIALTAE